MTEYSKIRVRFLATGLIVLVTSLGAYAQTVVPPRQKIAGLPVAIIREAFDNPDVDTRVKLFALLKQRVVKNSVARQRLLAEDITAAATFLAQYQYSVEMLADARNQTSNSTVRNKIDQVIAGIQAIQAATP